jgi:hypothetical protein
MVMRAAVVSDDVLLDLVDGLAESYFEGKAFARKGTTRSRSRFVVREVDG